MAAYKALGQENARLTAAAKGLERDLQRFTADGGALAAELHAARETVTRVEHENRQYVADLQAFERQADTLTREMHRCVSVCPSSLYVCVLEWQVSLCVPSVGCRQRRQEAGVS